MDTEYKVRWLGTPFAARLTSRFWIAGCIKARDPGAPSYLNYLIREWGATGSLPRPDDLVFQALLEASIHGGLILLYEYKGRLAPISLRITSKPLGFSGPSRRSDIEIETINDVVEGWARLILNDDLDWLEGVALEYPGGYSLTTKTGPGLESPCVYLEAQNL